MLRNVLLAVIPLALTVACVGTSKVASHSADMKGGCGHPVYNTDPATPIDAGQAVTINFDIPAGACTDEVAAISLFDQGVKTSKGKYFTANKLIKSMTLPSISAGDSLFSVTLNTKKLDQSTTDDELLHLKLVVTFTPDQAEHTPNAPAAFCFSIKYAPAASTSAASN